MIVKGISNEEIIELSNLPVEDIQALRYKIK